jgi:hypothetical protein
MSLREARGNSNDRRLEPLQGRMKDAYAPT